MKRNIHSLSGRFQPRLLRPINLKKLVATIVSEQYRPTLPPPSASNTSRESKLSPCMRVKLQIADIWDYPAPFKHSGKHFAEVCKIEYPKYVKFYLWLLAELAVITADIPEVIGTAFTLNILFHIPIWIGVLITGLSTPLLLMLQRYGVISLLLIEYQ